MAKLFVVYWLYDETCICIWSDGYVGFTGQSPPERFSQHQRTKGRYRRVPKNFKSRVVFRGSVKQCEAWERTLRPHTFIGWNILAGGSNSLKRHGRHNFRFGKRLSKEERQYISMRIKAAGPMTAEQRQRQIANTLRGAKHPAFGKPMKITNPFLGKDQSGTRNPFHGKTHTKEVKQILRSLHLRSSCKYGHPKPPGKPCRICGREASRRYRQTPHARKVHREWARQDRRRILTKYGQLDLGL